jgi:ABC-type long-subunit fatty acid transport system fused permease/ATPase subunit
LKQIEELGGEEGDYGSEDDIYDYICSRDSFEWETEKSYFYFYKYYAICIDTLGTGSQIEAKDQKYVINLVRECIKILEEYEVNMITQEIDANVGSNKKYAHKDMFERICNE